MKNPTIKKSDIKRQWWVVDASNVILGRLASEVARILIGKHKAYFTPHLDTGDHVVVINAAGIKLSGNKMQSKVWYRHSGYPGSLRALRYEKLVAERPEVVVEKAIKGMLPSNRLGAAMAGKLKVYAGPEHPHGAQNPEPLDIRATVQQEPGAEAGS